MIGQIGGIAHAGARGISKVDLINYATLSAARNANHCACDIGNSRGIRS